VLYNDYRHPPAKYTALTIDKRSKNFWWKAESQGADFSRVEENAVWHRSRQHYTPLQQWRCNAVTDLVSPLTPLHHPHHYLMNKTVAELFPSRTQKYSASTELIYMTRWARNGLLYRLSRDNLKHFYLPNLSHHFKFLSHICVPYPRSYFT